MKTITGFFVVIIGMVLFIPPKPIKLDTASIKADMDTVYPIPDYCPSEEVVQSREKVIEYKKKIKANIDYLTHN